MDTQGFISLNHVAVYKWRSGCFSGSEVIWLLRKSHPGQGGAVICRLGGDHACPCISKTQTIQGCVGSRCSCPPPNPMGSTLALAVRKQKADSESHDVICGGWLVTSQLGRGASGAERGPEGSEDSNNDCTFLCLSASLSIHLLPKPNGLKSPVKK